MKETDTENLLRLKMLRTSDELFLVEPGTIEQSVLFLELFSYERFRISKLLERSDREENFSRWKFLNEKLAEIEKKILQEKADIMLYEQVTSNTLIGPTKDCKIYSINDYQQKEGE